VGNLSWTVGDVRLTRVVESEVAFNGPELLPEATPEGLAAHERWLRPHFMTDDGQLLLSIHGLIVESGGARILVDTCVGERQAPGLEALTPAKDNFLPDLERAGFPRPSIDFVLCTHLHFDHVGCNTVFQDGAWVPSFPNARYLFARTEWEHWREEPESMFTVALDEAVRPVVDAGLADLVETDHRITDEVWLESTPGHTPGHVAVRISSRDRHALITGDLTHHPVQWAEPQWRMPADVDGDAAVETRRRLIEEHADTPMLIIGTHYAEPCAGSLVREGGVCRFETISGG